MIRNQVSLGIEEMDNSAEVLGEVNLICKAITFHNNGCGRILTG